MSVRNQKGQEVSRRDDLEALLYMSVHMFKQTLPWEGFIVRNESLVFAHRK